MYVHKGIEYDRVLIKNWAKRDSGNHRGAPATKIHYKKLNSEYIDMGMLTFKIVSGSDGYDIDLKKLIAFSTAT